jgi:predicted dehydrogenase
METIGVGLIGTGYMGKCHALAWTGVKAVFGTTPVVRRVALCEVDESLARRRADEFGFQISTSDWRSLVSNPEVDVVSITTPNAWHAPMAIAALEAGKHVWCEKPMAPALADAERMAAAAQASGRVAILGYNYIQSPAIRYIAKLMERGAIGPVTHFRFEMDEDYMADAEAPFSWKSEKTAGYGALDYFAVHPMSLVSTLFGMPNEVLGEMRKPYADRPDGASRRPVENFDVATILLRMGDGASGAIQVSRCAWGRKGRLQLQIFGAKGAIVFDQERFNEVSVYLAEGTGEDQGFRTVLMGPAHPPCERFIVAPAPDGIQRPQDRRGARAPEPYCGEAVADHRLRRGPRHRARHSRSSALGHGGAVARGGLTIRRSRRAVPSPGETPESWLRSSRRRRPPSARGWLAP